MICFNYCKKYSLIVKQFHSFFSNGLVEKKKFKFSNAIYTYGGKILYSIIEINLNILLFSWQYQFFQICIHIIQRHIFYL